MQKYWNTKSMLPEYRAQITSFLSEYFNIPDSKRLAPELPIGEWLDSKMEEDGYLATAIKDELLVKPVQRRNAKGLKVPLTTEELRIVARISDRSPRWKIWSARSGSQRRRLTSTRQWMSWSTVCMEAMGLSRSSNTRLKCRGRRPGKRSSSTWSARTERR
jgi:hypothetical protein